MSPRSPKHPYLFVYITLCFLPGGMLRRTPLCGAIRKLLPGSCDGVSESGKHRKHFLLLIISHSFDLPCSRHPAMEQRMDLRHLLTTRLQHCSHSTNKPFKRGHFAPNGAYLCSQLHTLRLFGELPRATPAVNSSRIFQTLNWKHSVMLVKFQSDPTCCFTFSLP